MVAILFLLPLSLRATDDEVISLVDRVSSATAAVCTPGVDTPRGAAWHVEDHEIEGPSVFITAAHLVDECKRPTLKTRGGAQAISKVVWEDEDTDIAVLRADLHCPAIPLAPADPRPGSFCMTLGFPVHLSRIATFGRIGGLKQHVDFTEKAYPDFTHYDMAVNYGNSGGVVVNRQGQAVSIVSVGYIKARNLNFGPNVAMLRKAFQEATK